jgi:hypothetical protein
MKRHYPPFGSFQSSSVDLRPLQPLESPHATATAKCVPRSRTIRLRKPTKLGVSAPWVRLDMRCCECVAKTWRYLVSRILAGPGLSTTGLGALPLAVDMAEGSDGDMAVAVEVAVSVRVVMAGTKGRGIGGRRGRGCGCPEADMCGRGNGEVGTESVLCQWHTGLEGWNDGSSSLALNAVREESTGFAAMAREEADLDMGDVWHVPESCWDGRRAAGSCSMMQLAQACPRHRSLSSLVAPVAGGWGPLPSLKPQLPGARVAARRPQQMCSRHLTPSRPHDLTPVPHAHHTAAAVICLCPLHVAVLASSSYRRNRNGRPRVPAL